ncbi:TonB-dependent receptor [Klebsiella sp. BIGb0407]|uniref:TonB-dependent receptor n=1 Tax=Klebsiella sp. BIGb0407 TaxID=2940603 RepID=UPI00216761DC|nr:TonB-dependent receptor [Klebsiella sp. BIGb0407]MCS3431810.1 hemoglobin/transferrin/lactoferrin receptor protein [Klebsiella sp. BIGb0407]
MKSVMCKRAPSRNDKKWLVASVFRISTLSLALMSFQQGAFAQTSPVTFNIPAGPLSGALAEFGRQSGLQISYPSEYTTGKQSAGVSGAVPAQVALGQLLQGSGLSWQFVNSDSITLTLNSATASSADDSMMLDTIAVYGHVGDNPADAPWRGAGSRAHLSAAEVERFSGTSVGDFLSGIPGVLNGDGRNSGALDVNIRGLQGQGRVPVLVDGASQETTVYQGYNGANARTYIDPDFIGSVDIEKGASMGADSAGAVGGIVRMNTIGVQDILLPGHKIGVRLKGNFNTNSRSAPAPGTSGGVTNTGTYWEWDEFPTSFGQPHGMNRPAFLKPTGGSGSLAIAGTTDSIDLVAAYAQRYNGNYYAGKNGSGAARIQISEPEDWGKVVVSDSNPLTPYRAGEQVMNTSRETESWLLKSKFRMDGGHTLELGYSRYLSNYGNILGSQALSFFGNPPYQSLLSTIDLATWTGRYSWKPEDSNLIDVKVDTFYSDVDNRVNSVFNSSGVLYPQYFWLASNRWGGNASNTSRFYNDIADVSWQYGGSFTRENVGLPDGVDPATMLNSRFGWRKEYSGFTTLEVKPLDWVTLSGNLRYSTFESHDRSPMLTDDINRKDHGWSPVISLTLEPLEGFQLYSKYGSVLRSPSIFESITGPSFSTVLAETTVAPERNNSLELGANYLMDGVLLPEDKLRFHGGWFSNHINNYITRGNVKYITASGRESYQLGRMNLDYAEMRGFELSAQYDSGRVFGSLAWNHYTDMMFCAKEGVLTPTAARCAPGGLYNSFSQQQVPPKDTLTLDLGSRFLDSDLTVGTRISYVGSRFVDGMGVTDESGQVSGQYSIAPSKWNPYTLVDLYASYKLNQNASFDMTVDNLTDRYYVDALNTIPVPAPGRTLRGGFTLKF